MKTERIGYLRTIALGLGAVTACTGNQSEAEAVAEAGADVAETGSMAEPYVVATASQGAPSDAAPGNAHDGLWITAPANLRFPSVDNVETAPSWSARVAKLPDSDQAYLSEVSDRYFGTMEFLGEAGQRKLVEQGFPMPEEWLPARNLPVEDPERLVEQDEVKAKMFYIDRISQEIAPILSRGEGLDSTTSEGRVRARQVVRARALADDLLQRTSSPFAAYLAGRIKTSTTFETPPEVFAGSFELAKDRGHVRAGEFQGKFFAKHPRMDAAAVMSSYTYLKADMKRR